MAVMGWSSGISGVDRMDGWANVVTGWGMMNRDKSKATWYNYAETLDRVTLEEMYRGDSIAAKIVDTLPNDMVREWIGVTVDGSDQGDVIALVLTALDDIGAQTAFLTALIWARLYGGSCIIMGINDGRTPDMPLDENNIQSITFLNTLERWQLFIPELYTDVTQMKYGQPKAYQVQQLYGGTNQTGQNIHESRVLRFDGVDLPPRQKYQNQGWGDSVLVRLFNAVKNYANAHDSAVTILQDFTQAVYQLKGLSQRLLNGDDQAVIRRLQALEMGKSITNAIALDEHDKYERQTTSVAGLADIVGCTERRLTAESNMPHSLLLGESPGASLGEAGEAQKRDWYDFVALKQKNSLKPPLIRLINLMFRCKTGPTEGVVPKNWELIFKSLWQPDEGDQVEIRLKQAQADDYYIGNGTLAPEEVAGSRFGSGKWSGETTIDMVHREVPEAPDSEEPADDEPGKEKPDEADKDEPAA